MKYLNIYFLSIALLFSFDLNASKYEKESASDLYKKATKQLKEEDYKNAELGVAFLMKDNALQIIAGTLTDFMKNFLSLIKAEKIKRDNFGIVCLLPKI